jgi:hypothetical protein
MIKYLIAISLIAACSGGWLEKHCDDPGRPKYPKIGGCIQDADQGSAGGSCYVGSACNVGLQCVGGICFDCGTTPQPCCGSQMSAAAGMCDTGTCALDTDGSGWYTCQGGTSTPSPGGCAPGAKPNYYVWTLTSICGKNLQTFCADSDADAQAYIDKTLGGVAHGPIGTDPNSIMPQQFTECGTGASCVVGSSDESKATIFFAFTHDQVVACEMQLDSMCQWVDGSNGMCPG